MEGLNSSIHNKIITVNFLKRKQLGFVKTTKKLKCLNNIYCHIYHE